MSTLNNEFISEDNITLLWNIIKTHSVIQDLMFIGTTEEKLLNYLKYSINNYEIVNTLDIKKGGSILEVNKQFIKYFITHITKYPSEINSMDSAESNVVDVPEYDTYTPPSQATTNYVEVYEQSSKNDKDILQNIYKELTAIHKKLNELSGSLKI